MSEQNKDNGLNEAEAAAGQTDPEQAESDHAEAEAADAGQPQDGEDAAEVSPQERIAELEAEVAELKDRLIRAMAETENVRRRAQREVEDAGKYAITKFARDVLTIARQSGTCFAERSGRGGQGRWSAQADLRGRRDDLA